MQSQVVARWFSRKPSAREACLAVDPGEFQPALKTRLLVLQPTPFCNIRCDYCYLPNRDSRSRMDVVTVGQAVQRLIDDDLLGSSITLVWHAGEPLAMPIDFYSSAIELVQSMIGPRCAVSHSVQTNAMLVNDEWCDLFKRHDIRIGVSIDGPASLHDAHRRTRHGHGTHERVLRGMAKLREHGIDFHVIAVLTAVTLDRADEFADFFEQQGVQGVGCNFDEIEGEYRESSLQGRESAHQGFLERMFDRSADSGGRLRLRELITANYLIAQALPLTRWRHLDLPDNMQTIPFAIVSVAFNGDFGCFSPELLGQAALQFDTFTLGNVARGGFFESARREPFGSIWAAIRRGVETCQRDCAHFSFCGGGSPVDKLFENGDLGSGETLYCRSMVKRPFNLALGRAVASRIRRESNDLQVGLPQ